MELYMDILIYSGGKIHNNNFNYANYGIYICYGKVKPLYL